MKIPMLVVVVGILSGVVTGLLVAYGFDQVAAGFLVVVLAGLLAFLYWRVRLALAKLLSNTRSIQKSLAQFDEFEKRLRKLQASVSNLESIADASTTRIRRDINHETGVLKSELLRFDSKLEASAKNLRDGMANGSVAVESRIAQLNELAEASTRRIRNDLKSQSRVTNALIERNHGARLKESDQNSRLLNALEKQRELLGTLVINSDFRFNNDGDQARFG